jgi:hypothetical protein
VVVIFIDIHISIADLNALRDEAKMNERNTAGNSERGND